MSTHAEKLSVFVLFVVRISSLAGFSKSIIVICTLWALPFLRPRSPVVRKRRTCARVCVGCVRKKVAVKSKQTRTKVVPVNVVAFPEGEGKVHKSENIPALPVEPVPDVPIRPLVRSRSTFGAAFSQIVRPIGITQRKLFRRCSRFHRDTESLEDSSTPPSTPSASSFSSSPWSDTLSTPSTELPPDIESPVRPSRRRTSSIIIRQHIVHAASHAANVFRKRRDSNPSIEFGSSSDLSNPTSPVSYFSYRPEEDGAGFAFNRKSSVIFTLPFPTRRDRSSSLVSPLCTAPLMEACDSNTTVTPHRVYH